MPAGKYIRDRASTAFLGPISQHSQGFATFTPLSVQLCPVLTRALPTSAHKTSLLLMGALRSCSHGISAATATTLNLPGN